MTADDKEVVSNKIFTIANLISTIRLCLVPAYFVLLLNGYDLLATILFAIAACTDWIDGQIARRTNTVTRLGQLLDPAVDRILIISCVIALLIIGRLPVWIIVMILLRDVLMLIGGAVLLRRFRIRIPVVFLGKVATTLLFVGFVGLLLNWPLLDGLGLTTIAWLPGFNHDPYSWGMWFVYGGMILAYIVGIYYTILAVIQVRKGTRDSDRVPR